MSACTTVILRGPTMDLIKEIQMYDMQSYFYDSSGFEDAIMICKRTMEQESTSVVCGGGACETQWYTLLYNKSQTCDDERRQVFACFAQCFLAVPSILLENAGASTQLYNKLEQLKAHHAKGQVTFGVDKQGNICDLQAVVEPTFLKHSILQTCSEATSAMLKIDHLVLEQLQQRHAKTGIM